MLTNIVEGYLQTGSSRMKYLTTSGSISGCLNIAPYDEAVVTPNMGINNAKFSFIVLSGGVPIAQIDNDHPINVSGSPILCLHEHVFESGVTVARKPLFIKTIARAGSYAQDLWNNIFR